jgi:hypothetical protein
LSYIISCFIIWENFETQNAFGNSIMFHTRRNPRANADRFTSMPKTNKGEKKPTNLTKNATKYSIPEKTMDSSV